jgi:uncharacterized protein YxeA
MKKILIILLILVVVIIARYQGGKKYEVGAEKRDAKKSRAYKVKAKL